MGGDMGVVVNAHDFEGMLRRVVREELAAVLAGGVVVPEPVAQVGPVVADERRENPFLLSDAELRTAEALLAEEERPILRKRVMAARLEQLGQVAAAKRMRRRADLMEQRLSGGH